MARRALTCAALALVLAAPAWAAGAAGTAGSWAQPQIKLVTARGLMGGKPAGFRPNDPLAAGELVDLLAGLTGKEAPMVADPSAPVTISQLDAQLVRALGLLPTARQFSAGLRAAGLVPTRYFGTEAVARLVGLRINHPSAQDKLELGPNDPATRAEAAYSAARVLGLAGGEVDAIAGLGSTFQLPVLTPLQGAVLQSALSFVGYPYVWGGTSERPQDPFATGKVVPGGFDCSGFVWRIFRLQAFAGAETLATTLTGRTTYAMSGEVPRGKRVPLARLQPADLVFFGAHGAKSKPGEIDHVGVYFGNGWFVHSSEQGVALALLGSDWYSKRFAWGRSPLAEAGLS